MCAIGTPVAASARISRTSSGENLAENPTPVGSRWTPLDLFIMSAVLSALLPSIRCEARTQPLGPPSHWCRTRRSGHEPCARNQATRWAYDGDRPCSFILPYPFWSREPSQTWKGPSSGTCSGTGPLRSTFTSKRQATEQRLLLFPLGRVNDRWQTLHDLTIARLVDVMTLAPRLAAPAPATPRR